MPVTAHRQDQERQSGEQAECAGDLRPVRLGPADVVVERRSDGTILMRSPHPLPPFPEKLTERLDYWAKAAPDRVFLAQRDTAGEWRTLTYAQAFASALIEGAVT